MLNSLMMKLFCQESYLVVGELLKEEVGVKDDGICMANGTVDG